MSAATATASSSTLRRLFLTGGISRSSPNPAVLLRHPKNSAARRTLTSSTKPASASASSASSPSPSLLAGDAGHKATHLHHHMTTLLVFATPLYIFALPDSYTNSIVDKGCGLVIASTISAHSWIGLNYVATDYVPKLSKSVLGPARVLNLGLAVLTLAGLGKIALGERGLRGTVLGLWRPAVAVAAETTTTTTTTVGGEKKE
jgi:succinate dehydrogenase hydrophobic anchor subunit